MDENPKNVFANFTLGKMNFIYLIFINIIENNLKINL
jgi:hypothetical protein